MLVKESSKLEVALTAETKLLGCPGRTVATTLPFHEHGQLVGNFIVGIDRQGSIGAQKGFGGDVEVH
jgi:hypothetical protein